MKHYRKETRYVSILTVHAPDASSLLDMLRYDRCCPATEADAGKIERMINQCASGADRIVALIRYSLNPDRATVGRWRSFGCTVLDERSPDRAPLTEHEALNLLAIDNPKAAARE
jgi:hypothetical protein